MMLKNKKNDLNFFIREKPTEILLAIKNNSIKNYCSVISKRANCTPGHTIHILSKLENVGLVKMKKNKRTKNIELTKRGQIIIENIIKIKEVMKNE